MSELELFLSADFAAAVEANLARDPLAVALDGRLANAAAVATQVKYLQRAQTKLPDWYSARCVFPGRAFEQSSSQAAALRKFPIGAAPIIPITSAGVTPNSPNSSMCTTPSRPAGRVALDLTCGLGVDSWALSRGFERVIAVERDPFLAAVARENFRRLGVNNVLVVNELAETFLAGTTERIDLVYVDPDRRSNEGRKLVRMEDCSPDVVALLPDLQRVTPRLVVKLSPLFDVAEVIRIFGRGTVVEVVSVDGECKEVVADVAFGSDRPSVVRAVAIGLGEAEYPFSDYPARGDGAESWNVALPDCCKNDDPFEPDRYKFLIVPDVALQKSRLATNYFRECGVWIDSDNGYGFALERPARVMGKVIDIQRIEPFDPKALKRRLKDKGVKNADIHKRNFPLSADELRRALGLVNGKSGSATLRLAFTSSAGKLWQITLS